MLCQVEIIPVCPDGNRDTDIQIAAEQAMVDTLYLGTGRHYRVYPWQQVKLGQIPRAGNFSLYPLNLIYGE